MIINHQNIEAQIVEGEEGEQEEKIKKNTLV